MHRHTVKLDKLALERNARLLDLLESMSDQEASAILQLESDSPLTLPPGHAAQL